MWCARLADWLVSRDNPYFSRAIVNRIWANFMGVGLVEAVDDMRVTNPASNEKLLSALAYGLRSRQLRGTTWWARRTSPRNCGGDELMRISS